MSTTIDVTVGKHDSSISYLTTPDFRILEYPSALLPNDVKTGTVLTITIAANESAEKEKNNTFLNFQNNLLKNLPQYTTKPPVLKVKSKLQTSINLQWDELDLGASSLKSVTLWHKEIKTAVDSEEDEDIDEDELSQVATIYNTSNTYKMTGLDIESKHAFQLRVDTSNGLYKSDVVVTSTLSSNDFSGFNVCVGALSTGTVTVDDVRAVADSLGIKNVNRVCNQDTTHFLTDVLDDENEVSDEHLLMAKELNIPIVAPNWLQGCATENKLLGVKGFYYKLGKDDPSNLVANEAVDKEVIEEKKLNNADVESGVNEGHESTVEAPQKADDETSKVEDEIPQKLEDETPTKVEDEAPTKEDATTSKEEEIIPAEMQLQKANQEAETDSPIQKDTENADEITETGTDSNLPEANNDPTLPISAENSASQSLTPVSTQSKKGKGKKKKNNKKKK
ncbi:unnamed protein product [Hanseniaspora opuntiae]